MRAARIVAAISIAASALAVGPLTSPAGAAVSATTAGTAVTVTANGDVNVEFGCSANQFSVNAVVAAPALSCAAVTQVTVNGDGANQRVYGASLEGSTYAGLPKIIATLGDGADYLSETSRADQVSMGTGNDGVSLQSGGAVNGSMDLGAGTFDSIYLSGTAISDTMTATSGSPNANIATTNTEGATTSSATNAEYLSISGGEGDDTISTTGVIGASTIDSISLEGGDGNDTLTDGPVGTFLYGGTGTNTLTGGAGQDSYWSSSPTDTLDGGDDATNEWIYDTDGLRSGGRTLSGFTALDNYTVQAHKGDVTMRIRPAPGGASLFTTSLTRPGQQVVPAPVGGVSLGQSYVGALAHRGLADVVATADQVTVTLPSTGGGLVDVTIPTGLFTADLIGTNLVVLSSYGQVNAAFVGDADDYRVHGPWTNKNQGFAHRAVRDLMFRFPSNSDRDQIRDQLTNGTRTRAAVAQSLISSDEYRGLDVDRTFVKYLRRVSDPGGRTYWINSIRNGKALWRFRAQLFGSNEYFSKAGGSNGSYVAKAYEDVLGRAPDPSGRTYWTNKLDNGADRGSVALQFINSPEARRRLVDDQFLRFLDRLPTATEQTTWVAALPGATGEQDLIAALVSGASYYNRS